VLGTRALSGALARLGSPPVTLVAASAIGWYGDTGGREADESAPPGTTFLARLVRGGEATAQPAEASGIRVVHTRSGLVFTPAGGFLAGLLPVARLGLLPRFASGTQAMSWISLTDEIGAIRFLLGRTDISGPVNLTAPETVTNSAFTAALNAAAGRRDRYARAAPEVKFNAVEPGYTTTELGGVKNELGRPVEISARNIVRMATIGKDGPTGTFAEDDGELGW
jgi:uncharacterized protein